MANSKASCGMSVMSSSVSIVNYIIEETNCLSIV